MKKNIFTLFALLALLVLAACGGDDKPSTETEGNEGEASGDKEQYVIGVTQIVEHPSLNAAFDGFKQALEDAGLDVTYDVQNAQNDQSINAQIATNLVGDQVDLIFANSTPSALAAKAATDDIPIVFTSVTNAVEANLVDSNEAPGGNVTGTTDNHPEAVAKSIEFLKDELGSTKIGMVFDSGEQNSRVQIDQAKAAAEQYGVEIIDAAVSSSAEVKQATESLIGKVDSIYIITDNTVVNALESVVGVAEEHDLPMFVAEFDSVERGGLGAFGFEFYDIGYEAGEMAVQILKDGKKPADIPVQVPQNLRLQINEEKAKQLNIEIKEEWNAELK